MKKRFTQNDSFNLKWTFQLTAIIILLFSGTNLSRATTNNSMQSEKVSGTVVDAKTGEAIIGASVQVYGTKKGTITDFDGKFNIEVADPNKSKLQISYVGYKPQQVSIKGQTDLKIKLEDNSQELNEVVVVGYGTSTKGATTSSVSTVKAKDLNLNSVANVDNALQGGVAGLNVAVNSAMPGGSTTVSLRGALSSQGSNEPLYVIDGIPIMDNGGMKPNGGQGGTSSRSPLSTINPSDIESINVLKDASATAIYGSAAANGVILITTKSGKSGEAKVSYDGKFSLQPESMVNFYEPMNAIDYMNTSNIGFFDYKLFKGESVNGTYVKFNPYGPGVVRPGMRDSIFKFTPAEIAANPKSYNHIKDIMRDGTIQEHNVSLSGGTEKSSYFLSLGTFNQKSILKSTDFNRYSGRVKLDNQLATWLKSFVNASFSAIDAYNPSVGGSESGANRNTQYEMATAMAYSPLVPLYDGAGLLTHDSNNPQAINPGIFQTINDRTYTMRMIFTPSLEANITKDLKLTARMGIDYSTSERRIYSPMDAKLPTANSKNYATFTNSAGKNTSLESFLDYKKNFESKHDVLAVIGVGRYDTYGISHDVTAHSFSSDEFSYNNLAMSTDKSLDNLASNKYTSTKLSSFARFNYTYDSRYVFSFTGRVDGSTNFAPKHKYGFFPGVSAAWNISEEEFLKGGAFSNLKLRLGYGTTGNESVVANKYLYLTQFAPGWGTSYIFGGKEVLGYMQSAIRNDDLKWETDIMYNIGVDFAVLKDRLSGTIELYDRVAKDLLLITNTPLNSPISKVAKNVGVTEAKGVELTLNFNVVKTKNMSWDINLTCAHVVSRWVERDKTVALSSWIGEHDEINAIYGMKTTGGLFKSLDEVKSYNAKIYSEAVNKTDKTPVYDPNKSSTWFQNSFPGDVKYVDINHDGIIDEKDVVKLGCYDPFMNFGLRSTFRYYNWDFTIGTYGVINQFQANGYETSLPQDIPFNTNIQVKDVWSSFNQNGIYRGVTYGFGSGDLSNKSQYNDYLTQNVSFIRLKNLTVAYTFQSKNGKLPFKSIRTYLDANNLAMLTNYQGVDPEMSANKNSFPIPVSFTLGANISF